MLPWIFAVLLLLNVVVFIFGYQREQSREPPPLPVPEGTYQIRLLSEVTEGTAGQEGIGAMVEGETEAAAPTEASGTEGGAKEDEAPVAEDDLSDRPDETNIDTEDAPSENSPPLGESAAVDKSAAVDEETELDASEDEGDTGLETD